MRAVLLTAVAMKWKEDVILEDFDDTIELSADRSWQKGRSVTAPSDRLRMKNVEPIPLRLAWSNDETTEERKVGRYEEKTPTSARELMALPMLHEHNTRIRHIYDSRRVDDATTSNESDVSSYWPFHEWKENGSLDTKEVASGRHGHTKKTKRWNIATRLRRLWKRRRLSVSPAPMTGIYVVLYTIILY